MSGPTIRPSRRRRIATGAFVAALIVIGLSFPSGASAGRLEAVDDLTLLYTSYDGEPAGQAYDLVVDDLGNGFYQLTDRAAEIDVCGAGDTDCAPPLCIEFTPHEAICAASLVRGLVAFLGQSNDRFENRTSVLTLVCGGGGEDSFLGGPARDTFGGGAGRDEVRGGGGGDTLAVNIEPILGTGIEACKGGGLPEPRELLDGGAGTDHIIGGPGADVVRGGDDDDEVLAHEGDDRISGGGGRDVLLGLDGADVVRGEADGDFLFGGPGDDDLDGGPGDDDLGRPVRYDVDSLGSGTTTAIAPEDGDDRLDGGEGSDGFTAGPGAFVYSLVDVEETLARLRSGVVDVTLQSSLLNGADRYIGGPGDDRVMYSNRTLPVEVSLDGLPNDGSAGEGDGVDPDVEQVGGGAAGDTLRAAPSGTLLFGDLGGDVLLGGPGPDFLNGGPAAGADRAEGAGGDDELIGGPGDDVLNGGIGLDLVSGGGDDDALSGGHGPDSLQGGPGSDNVFGGADADCVAGFVFPAAGPPSPGCPKPAGPTPAVGSDTGDILNGGAGQDQLAGGDGEDLADYSDRRRRVQVVMPGAGPRWSALVASAPGEDGFAADIEGVRGGRGHDLLVGNAGDNVLDGGPGSDQVEGGSGVDRLRGGSGADLVTARDRESDAVRCGTKRDLALIDPDDAVVAALSDVCERVDGRGTPRRTAARVRPAPGCLLPVRFPGTARFFLLGTRAPVPPGTKVDASSCAARLRGAELSLGAFSVGPGLTLRLRHGPPVDCSKADAPVRRLSVRRAPGGLRVLGRLASGEGRGAAWTTVDGCDRTVVRAWSGRVRVVDAGDGREVVLRAGERHVARREGGGS